MAWGTTTNGDGSRHVEACIAEVRLHLAGHPRELAMFNNHLDLEPDAKDLIDVCNAVLQDTTGRTRQIIAEADDALLNRHLKQPQRPETGEPPPPPRDHWIIQKLKSMTLNEWIVAPFVLMAFAFALVMLRQALSPSPSRERTVGQDIDLGRNTIPDIPDPKELVGTLWMIDATNPPKYLIAPPYGHRQLGCTAFDDPGSLLCLAPLSRRGTRAFDLRLGRNIAVEPTAGPAPPNPKPSNDSRWRASSEPPGHQTHIVIGNLYHIPATAPPQYLVRYLDSERSNIVLHCQAHEKAPQAAAYAKAPTGDVRDAAKLDAAAQIRCQPFRINPALQAGTFFDVSRGVVARAPDDLAAAPLPVLTFLQALPADLRYNGLFIEDDPPYQERR